MTNQVLLPPQHHALVSHFRQYRSRNLSFNLEHRTLNRCTGWILVWVKNGYWRDNFGCRLWLVCVILHCSRRNLSLISCMRQAKLETIPLHDACQAMHKVLETVLFVSGPQRRTPTPFASSVNVRDPGRLHSQMKFPPPHHSRSQSYLHARHLVIPLQIKI